MDLSFQKEYWNKVAPAREFTTPLDGGVVHTYIDKKARILDYGCGYGRSLDELHRLGYTNLIGFDIAGKMVLRGRKQFPHLDLQVQKGHAIGLPDQSIDVVLLFAVLTCVVEDQALENVIREIQRLLRPGGYLLINDFLLNEDERNIRRYRRFESKYGEYGIFELPDGGVLRHFGEERIFSLCSRMEVVRYEKTRFTTMNGNPANGFNLLLKHV